MNPRSGFPKHKVTRMTPPKLSFSFFRRQPAKFPTVDRASNATPVPPLQFPEYSIRRDYLRPPHHNSYPRSHHARHSVSYSPGIYLHTPQRELDGWCPPGYYARRLSLPTTPNPLLNSALHMPVSVESFVVTPTTSTRASLRSIATDSLALGSHLEKVQGRDWGR
jgi:hypothetical protein